MSNDSPSGFLVVLRDSGYTNSFNPKYHGVDRVPPNSSAIPQEQSAIDDYVFGDYKDIDSNLIPEFAKAYELWQRFGDSPREFEIVACCRDPDDPLLTTIPSGTSRTLSLGYDVAGLNGDCWSIVEDFARSEWARHYHLLLNDNGLFDVKTDAENYLEEYKRNCETYHDAGFVVVFVVSIEPRTRDHLVQ